MQKGLMDDQLGGYRDYRDLGVLSVIWNPTTDPKHGVEPRMDTNGREFGHRGLAAKNRNPDRIGAETR